MPIAHPATAPDAAHGAVSAHLSEIEAHLAELDAALASGDANRIERQSQVLQMGLAKALSAFRQASASGLGLATELQHRLALARTRCLQQQQAVQLASASLGRTLGVLFPGDSSTYGVPGQGPAARALSAYR